MTNRILIVGGGLSGRLLALNLLWRAPPTRPVAIKIIDRGGHQYMGPAYSNESPILLLNVPVEIMGALSEDPEHFRRWVVQNGGRAEPGTFLPRRLYRDYVYSLMEGALRGKPANVAFDHIQDEVTDIELDGDQATAFVENRDPLQVDSVVLALGNFPPPDPGLVDRSTREGGRYAADPWNSKVFGSVARQHTVVFIGTGQTMVDLSLVLHEKGHKGQLIGISRRGLLPMVHDRFDEYPSFFDEIRDSKDVAHIFSIVRKHAERAAKIGIDQRAVIDSMRADTQKLWSGLPDSEKRRFMRHVFRYWERIRSRIPPESQETINELRDAGQLKIVAGRILELVDNGTRIEVYYKPRAGGSNRVLKADLVVNCIGPETNYRRVNQPLVQNLLRRGLIRPGPADMGMDALQSGEVVGANGQTSGMLYTLGSTMKGLVWEVLAVPDISVQAEELAELLLDRNLPAGPTA